MGRFRTLTGLEIRPLAPEDSDELASMLRACSTEYQRFFAPFPFEGAAIRKRVVEASQDRYWAIRVGAALAGFFMLRGFDEGYDVPSFGVSIGEAFAGRGLLKLTLSFTVAWCRLNQIDRIMLKVYPENVVAKRAYERFGFQFDRLDDATGQLIFRLSLADR